MILKNIIIALILFVALQSCRSTKEIKTVIAPKDSTYLSPVNPDSLIIVGEMMKEFNKNYIDFETFSAKIKLDVEDKNGKQPDLVAVVRMIKDSAIWVSLSATFLNIEVYRVLITKDQVILLNKQDKEVQYRTLDYLQEVTSIPFDFKTLENMLIGNPVYYSDKVSSFRKQDNVLLFTFIGEFFKHLMTISADSKLLLYSKLDDVELTRNRTASISYSEYENISGRMFSTNRHMVIAEKNKMDIRLKYKQVEFNKELSVNLTVPKNYSRK